MNREAFFFAIRPAFGGAMTAAQVDGMNSLLDVGADLPLHHMANVLAQVRRETGGYMSPIKETVMPHHKDKLPSDAEVIRRLDRAFAAGKLKWVKTPYWRDGWFGRGQIQLTHRKNYAKFGITDPAAAMHTRTSAMVAVRGMANGMFTGKKLSDYRFPEDLDAPPDRNPRRIVNGQDGSDREVAHFHRQFVSALSAAGWPLLGHVNKTAKSEHDRPDVLSPRLREAVAQLDAGHVQQTPPVLHKGWIATLIAAIAALFKVRK